MGLGDDMNSFLCPLGRGEPQGEGAPRFAGGGGEGFTPIQTDACRWAVVLPGKIDDYRCFKNDSADGKPGARTLLKKRKYKTIKYLVELLPDSLIVFSPIGNLNKILQFAVLIL